MRGLRIGRRSKYNTALRKKDKPCVDGYVFDSIREKDYYLELKLRKSSGDVKEFQVKPKFWIAIRRAEHNLFYLGIWVKKPTQKDADTILFTYTPDFVVDDELVDVKGFITPEFKLKAKMMAALGLPVKIVK